MQYTARLTMNIRFYLLFTRITETDKVIYHSNRTIASNERIDHNLKLTKILTSYFFNISFL